MQRNYCKGSLVITLPATQTPCDTDAAANNSQQDVRRCRQPERVRIQHRVTVISALRVSGELAVGTIDPHVTCQQ